MKLKDEVIWYERMILSGFFNENYPIAEGRRLRREFIIKHRIKPEQVYTQG